MSGICPRVRILYLILFNQKALHELKSLHPEEQQVILLKTIQDLTLREIGEIMNLSIGKVAYRLNAGLKQLANQLKNEGIL